MARMPPQRTAGPRRGRPLIPAAVPRRGELLAALALTATGLHVLLAPLVLVLTALFTVVSRITRWRPWWLLAPAVAGLAWALATGPHQATAGFTAWPAAVFGHVTALRAMPSPRTGAGRPPPGQVLLALPLALPLAAAEAAAAGWLDWRRTDEWALRPPRPGLVAALRATVASHATRAGAVVTRTGCALGIVPATGRVAELGWAEARSGVLVTAATEPAVTAACRQVVQAALRRRKPLIVLDPGPGSDVPAFLTAACAATGTPLLSNPAEAAASPSADASQLWARGHRRTTVPPRVAGPPVSLTQVVSGRLAVLLPAGTAELAAGACAALRTLASDLRRIGVDGDALVWVPRAERLAWSDLPAVVRDGAATGLAVLAGTTSPGAATELADVFGALLVGPVSDRELAAALAGHTGTRLLPPPVAALLSGERPPPADSLARPPGAAPPDAAGSPGLVPSPAVPAQALLALGDGDFVLAVSAPAPRLVAAGRLVPARLPRPVPSRPAEPPP